VIKNTRIGSTRIDRSIYSPSRRDKFLPPALLPNQPIELTPYVHCVPCIFPLPSILCTRPLATQFLGFCCFSILHRPGNLPPTKAYFLSTLKKYSLSDRRHRLRHQRIKAFSQFFLELVDQTLRGLQTSFSEGRALEKDLCPIGKAAYVHPAPLLRYWHFLWKGKLQVELAFSEATQ
jgi:hypothetical protein